MLFAEMAEFMIPWQLTWRLWVTTRDSEGGNTLTAVVVPGHLVLPCRQRCLQVLGDAWIPRQ
jgi:hypothetical protein